MRPSTPTTLLPILLPLLGLAGSLAAQGAAEPADLRLKGDPAQDLDLGASRVIPMPVREEADGPVVSAPYVCARSVRRGRQVVGGGREPLPARLLGETPASVMPWLRRLDEAEVSAVWTPRWTLVGILDAGAPGRLRPEELVRLRGFFPDLGAHPKSLSGLQRTHLWALRLLELESGISELLDLDDAGRIKSLPGRGYRPLAHDDCEIYLFSSRKAHDAFRRHLFGKTMGEGLDGEVLGSGPVTALVAGGAPPRDVRRRFLHTATLQLLRVHRRMEGGLPDWIRIGLAHYFERRHRSMKVLRDDRAGTLPDDAEVHPDWDQCVRDLVADGKAGQLVALTATPLGGLSAEIRLQSWSLVRYLLGLGIGRFRTLLLELYHVRPGTAPSPAIETALEASYGHEPQRVLAAWKAWVLGRGS